MSKPTKNVKRGWVALGAVLVVAVLFGAVVLPRIAPDQSAGGAMKGQLAPDFSLPVIFNGESESRIHLADLRGKAVVLDFWASWCMPCRQEAPILDSVARSHRGKGVIFVGINTGDQRQRAIDFAKSRNLTYTEAFDTGGHVADAYGVQGLPTLVVIDPKGRVTAMLTRLVSRSEVEALVDKALSG